MATTITQAEFETLPESLKSKFTPMGEDFSLIEEDVAGLRKSKELILAEKKRLEQEGGIEAMAREYEELKRFKAEIEFQDRPEVEVAG